MRKRSKRRKGPQVGAAHLFDSSPQLQLTARGKPSVPVSQGKFT